MDGSCHGRSGGARSPSGGGASSCGWRTVASPGVDVPVLGVVATARRGSRSSATSVPTCAGPSSPTSTRCSSGSPSAADDPLAGALLDQRNVAGFGNVYAVELPFVVGVSTEPAGRHRSTGCAGLLGLGTAVIRTNADRGPQNTTGRKLQVADHWIYGRRGRPCPLCGTRSTGWTSATARGAGSPVVPDVPGRRADPVGRPRAGPAPAGAAPGPPRADVPRAEAERS